MSAQLSAAATVYAPPGQSTADPTHQAGLIFRVAHSATSGSPTGYVAGTITTHIPKNMRGRYWRLLSVGANVNWCWVLRVNGVDGVAPTLVYGQLTATNVGNAAAAGTLLDSQERHIECPANAVGLVSISSAGAAAGTWFEAEASGPKLTANAQP